MMSKEAVMDEKVVDRPLPAYADEKSRNCASVVTWRVTSSPT
jgi:hypothetical protein